MAFIKPNVRRIAASSFLRHGALTFSALALLNASAFAFHAFASRALGVGRYGALYALLSLLPLFALPATVVATVVSKVSAEIYAAGDAAVCGSLLTRVKVVSIYIAAAVAVGSAAIGVFAARYLHVTLFEVGLLAALICMTTLVAPLRAFSQGTSDFRGFTASCAIEGMLKTACGAALVFVGFGSAGALGGYVFGMVVTMVYTWRRLSLRWITDGSATFHIDLRRTFMTLSGSAALVLTTTTLSYADAVVVKHYFVPSQAGLYAAAALSGKILLFATSFLPLVMLPKAAARSARTESAWPLFAGAIGVWGGLSACGLLIFYLWSGGLLRILVGPEFSAAARLGLPYAVAMVLLAGMNVTASFKLAIHRMDFVTPFVFLAVAEIVTIAAYHPSLLRVIQVLIVGNALGFCASLYGLAPERRVPTSPRTS